jgi:hypothetical protein
VGVWDDFFAPGPRAQALLPSALYTALHLLCTCFPARRYKYFFQQHFFEGLVWLYGGQA